MSASVATHIACDNEQLLANLRRSTQSRILEEVGRLESVNADMLAAEALLELLLPIKHAIFMPITGLHMLLSSNRWLF